MLKLTFCLRRLPSLSLAQFQDYWLNRHGPLVRRLQPALGMVRYVQLHRLDTGLADGMRTVRNAPEPYDGIAELWWESEEAFRAARGPEAREAGRLLLDDEARFIDLPNSPLWLNREEEIYPGSARVSVMKRLILALLGFAAFAVPSAAQSPMPKYPNKPIRLVVGYSPGGGNDLIARIVAAKLQGKLGQPVVVDNKPGAQSIVAAELVAKAAPDGYTLLIAPSGPMTINPAVYSKLPYDPLKDFEPISLLAEFPLLLVVGADQPVKSIKDLVDYGKANPKLANYASSATPFQLASELFNQRTGSKFQHIPYRGSGDMVQALLSGQVLMAFADPGPVAGPLKAGKLRALGITTAKRPPDFPDVPTLAEGGFNDMEILLWTGLVAPAGTPSEIVSLLQDAVVETLEMTEVKGALEAISVDPRSTSSKEFGEIIARDGARWKEVAAKANIKLD